VIKQETPAVPVYQIQARLPLRQPATQAMTATPVAGYKDAALM
jgi:hypothetical protein